MHLVQGLMDQHCFARIDTWEYVSLPSLAPRLEQGSSALTGRTCKPGQPNTGTGRTLCPSRSSLMRDASLMCAKLLTRSQEAICRKITQSRIAVLNSGLQAFLKQDQSGIPPAPSIQHIAPHKFPITASCARQRDLLRRALDGREGQLGMHHPTTLGSVYNLAALFGGQRLLWRGEGVRSTVWLLGVVLLVSGLKMWKVE